MQSTERKHEHTHTHISFENAIIAFEILKELSCLMAQNLKMERSAVFLLKIDTYLIYKEAFSSHHTLNMNQKKNKERMKKSNCFLTTLSHSLI